MDENFCAEESLPEALTYLPRTTAPSEEDAVRRLTLLDLPGARAAVESFLKESIQHAQNPLQASYLLYDLLSRTECVVAEHQGIPQRGLPERLSIVRRLAAARTNEDLLWAFWSAYDSITKPISTPAQIGHPAVEQVKSFIRENYTHKIALAEIAMAVGVSRNYLSHLFRRHCGVTVTEFIHRIRIRQAESLLTHGGRTVSEIAYLVGYQNYRDFHRNFVKYEKTSPKKFRQFKTLARRPASTLPP